MEGNEIAHVMLKLVFSLRSFFKQFVTAYHISLAIAILKRFLLSEVALLTTPKLTTGLSISHQELSLKHAKLYHPGVWMIPTSKSKLSGGITTEPLINLVTSLIFN